MSRLAVPIVVLAFSFIIIIVEACNSNTSDYVDKIMDEEEASTHTEQIRGALPTIKWSVECWHYYRPRNAGPEYNQSNTEKRRKIFTHRETKHFYFRGCIDASGPLPSWFLKNKATRVSALLLLLLLEVLVELVLVLVLLVMMQVLLKAVTWLWWHQCLRWCW